MGQAEVGAPPVHGAFALQAHEAGAISNVRRGKTVTGYCARLVVLRCAGYLSPPDIDLMQIAAELEGACSDPLGSHGACRKGPLWRSGLCGC